MRFRILLSIQSHMTITGLGLGKFESFRNLVSGFSYQILGGLLVRRVNSDHTIPRFLLHHHCQHPTNIDMTIVTFSSTNSMYHSFLVPASFSCDVSASESYFPALP